MYRDSSGSTAQTLILIGLVFQFVEVLIFFGAAAAFLGFPIVGLLFLALSFVGVIWLLLVYVFSYGPTREGDYEAARTPTLVFGILSLLTGSLISGILYLVAYAKLGDTRVPLYPTMPLANPFPYGPPPPSAVPPGTRYCVRCGTPALPGAAFCRTCGTPVV